MRKKHSIHQSALLFFSAFFGGALLWQLGIFFSDRDLYGGTGALVTAGAVCAGAALATAWHRREARFDRRCAILLLAFLLWNFCGVLAIASPRIWQIGSIVLALVAGGALGTFLRGARGNPIACLGGLCIYPLVACAASFGAQERLLPDFWPLLLTGAAGPQLIPSLLFFLAAALTLLIAIPACTRRPLSLSGAFWATVTLAILLAAAMRTSYQKTVAAVEQSEGSILRTLDGSRIFIPLENGSGGLFFHLNGKLAGQSPCDLVSRPALLPTLLQFTNHNLQVLVVAPPFSVWPLEAGRYPWVARVDHLSNDAALARLAASTSYTEANLHQLSTPYQLGGPYDLVAVSCGDPLHYSGLLTRNGVLAVVPGLGDPKILSQHFSHSLKVPGPGGVTLYSNRPLEEDLKHLDEQMRRSSMGASPVPAGVLEILYDLPAGVPEAVGPDVRPEPGHPAITAWSSLPDGRELARHGWLWGAGVLLFLILRIWRFFMERRVAWQGVFFDLDTGLATAFGLVILELALLELGVPLFIRAGAPVLAVLLLLPRESLPRGVRNTGRVLVGLAPLAAAWAIPRSPWLAFAAGALTLAALNLWRIGHTSHAPFATGRLWLGAAIGFAFLLAATALGPGGFWFAAVAFTLWRRLH